MQKRGLEVIRFRPLSQYLVLLRGDVSQNVTYLTSQNPAQVIDGGRAERLVLPQSVNC